MTPATNVMSIAELDRVWVLAEVFERQAAWVAVGQAVTVRLDYLPGRTWEGRVDYVYPELDPTARVTIEGAPSAASVHVPREAVIRGGQVDRVVLDLGEGRYRAQPVKLGIESGDRVAIRDGVTAGDRVVTSAQFLIDSESNIESALQRMDPGVDEEGEDGMDHSMHEMDHSMHDMDRGDETMDHSMHDMDHGDETMDHSMHGKDTQQ